MTCPHCQATINRRERSGNHCSKCMREFAFDPKGNALRIHDLRFRKQADRLALGGFKFSVGQLRTALSSKWGVDAGMYFGLAFVTAIGIAGVTIRWTQNVTGGGKVFACLFGTILFALAAYLVVQIRRDGRPMTDALFRGDFLERWRKVYGSLPKGLIDGSELAALGASRCPPGEVGAVLVCPERGLLDCLLANGVAQELRLGLLTTEVPADEVERSLLETLRRNPRLPILLLHDASAEGVFLAQDLPQLLGLDPRHRILDLGLNARKSMAKKRPVRKRPVPPALLARLDTANLGADVAGARPLRRGRAQVSKEELDWLKSDHYSPVLAIPPGKLIKRIRLAMTKLKAYREPLPAEVAAQASLGFLTWPT